MNLAYSGWISMASRLWYNRGALCSQLTEFRCVWYRIKLLRWEEFSNYSLEFEILKLPLNGTFNYKPNWKKLLKLLRSRFHLIYIPASQSTDNLHNGPNRLCIEKIMEENFSLLPQNTTCYNPKFSKGALLMWLYWSISPYGAIAMFMHVFIN